MSDERFEKYVNQVVENKSPNEFLQENRKLINQIKRNPKFEEEFNYYKALSNKLRFLIYKTLQQHPMCTCALAKLFNKKENLINHHLKLMESYGLLRAEKEGYFTIYYPIM